MKNNITLFSNIQRQYILTKNIITSTRTINSIKYFVISRKTYQHDGLCFAFLAFYVSLYVY